MLKYFRGVHEKYLEARAGLCKPEHLKMMKQRKAMRRAEPSQELKDAKYERQFKSSLRKKLMRMVLVEVPEPFHPPDQVYLQEQEYIRLYEEKTQDLTKQEL